MYSITYTNGPSYAICKTTRTAGQITDELAKIGSKNIDTAPEVYREAFRHLVALERLGARGIEYANQDFDILSAADQFISKIARRGIEIGDTVRLYGYPGTFTAGLTIRTPDVFKVRSVQRPNIEFNTPFCSVVEINGKACPLQSCPLDMPADDYPHALQFDYDDGPQERAAEILAKWHREPAHA